MGEVAVTELNRARRGAPAGEGQVLRRPALSSWAEVLDYVRAAQAYEHRECFRILFLDKKNHLIADECSSRAPWTIRGLRAGGREAGAGAVGERHHPGAQPSSGDPTPSRADIDMTKLIVEAARPLGVVVHDHIVVGRQGHASFKALRLI